MHGVAPVLVSLGAPRLRLSRYIRYGYIWPVIYLVTLAALAAVGWVEVPYPFLQPSRIGWVGVTATLAAPAATVAAVSGALWAISTLLPTTDRDVTTTRT